MCAFIRHLESYHQQRMTTVFSVQTRYLEGTPQCDFRHDFGTLIWPLSEL